MNRIRAYLDRIQGRLLAALTLGALGMLAIDLVSSRTLAHFSDRISDELAEVQDRVDRAVQLEAAIVDQISATQPYLMTAYGAAELVADRLKQLVSGFRV
jgi:CHASE3 domain sensor protein